MNKITVPFIEGLEKMTYDELDLAMEKGAAKGNVSYVCWPEVAAYQPDCCFSVARSKTHLAVLYHVRGLDLRAVATEDNGSVWEDSCCEFFVDDPSDGTYYNFEMNCIGTLLNGKGADRNERVRRPAEELKKVIRHSTLPHQSVLITDKICQWSIAMVIPFEMMGVDPENLPSCLRVNFYKCGDNTAHPHFVSWNPVECPQPNFHRPDYFGVLMLK